MSAFGPTRVETVVAAGVTLIEWHFQAGTITPSEVHPYDHLSMLVSGEGILTTEGVNQSVIGPCRLVIKAGIKHYFHAITDCIWDCIHAGDEPVFERNP